MNSGKKTFEVIHLDQDSYTQTEVVEVILTRWKLTAMRNDDKYGKTRLSSLKRQINRKFKSRRMTTINADGIARYRREDVEHFLNDTNVRKYLLEFAIEWHEEVLRRSNTSSAKIKVAQEELEKAKQEMQILAFVDSVAAEHRENVISYYVHAADDVDEIDTEVPWKIEEAKRQILFQVLSDFVFNDVIEFDEASYLCDLQNKPDDGGGNPSPYQVLAGEGLLDLRNYYKYRSDAAPGRTILTQEIYRILADFRMGIKADIAEVLNRYNNDKKNPPG